MSHDDDAFVRDESFYAEMRAVAVVSVLMALIAWTVLFPRYVDHDREVIAHLTATTSCRDCHNICSYNIRLDGEEDDIENHFTRRDVRLSKFFNETSPLLCGLQEPFGGQMLHLGRMLPPQLRYFGWERNPTDPHAYQTAIVYDASRLRLLKSDHMWLSETPRIPGSKSFGSLGSRTVTMGAFEFKVKGAQTTLLHFNTHLDVWSAEARAKQTRLLKSIISQWRSEYPGAIVVVTGDFNSANGQLPHSIMLHDNELVDVWDACGEMSHCVRNAFSSSFHGWYGTWVDRYMFRGLRWVLHTLHGCGLEMRKVVWSAFDWTLLQSSIPRSLARMHVDWIMVSPEARPRKVFVGEVRDAAFSSDHFPIIAQVEFCEKHSSK